MAYSMLERKYWGPSPVLPSLGVSISNCCPTIERGTAMRGGLPARAEGERNCYTVSLVLCTRSGEKRGISFLVWRNRAYFGRSTDAVFMFIEQIEEDRNGHTRKQKGSNLSGYERDRQALKNGIEQNDGRADHHGRGRQHHRTEANGSGIVVRNSII